MQSWVFQRLNSLIRDPCTSFSALVKKMKEVPREVVDAPSMKVSKVRLVSTLRNLV